MQPKIQHLLILLIAPLVVAWAVTARSEEDWRVELLNKNGVSAETESLLEFLRGLRPAAAKQVEVAGLIQQLGSDNYRVREHAQQSLARLGIHAQRQLGTAAKSDDLEVAVRARRLLKEIIHTRDSELHNSMQLAVLQLLRERPSPQATAILLDTMSDLRQSHLRDAAAEALWASAAPADEDRLRQAISKKDDTSRRTAAIVALELAAGEAAVPVLQPLLVNEQEAVRLAAARALVNRLPRECLDALIKLLDSKSLNTRLQASSLLRELTDQTFGLDVRVDFDDSIKQWKRWHGQHAAVAKLRIPVGKQRLQLAGHRAVFHEAFSGSVPAIKETYGRFQYKTTVAAKASVADGTLRLDGEHPEGDQRVVVTAKRLLGQASFPDQFHIRTKLGGENKNCGAYHVGISVGNVRILFHPGYPGGGFRAERVDSHKYLIGNVGMTFTPAADVMHEMQMHVQRKADGGVRFDVRIINAQNLDQDFKTTVNIKKEDIGVADAVGLDRSGRTGGAGLFESLTIRLSQAEPVSDR